ncbi:MAG: hypothetical protein K5796_03200 [Lachnospiraceae bacterium]|nr:hypothetical protein [Lachnospiraceae bacterium]
MKKEELFDAVTDINDEFIEEAGRTKIRKITRIIRYAGNAAAVVIIGVIILNQTGFRKDMAKNEFVAESVASTAAVANNEGDVMLDESKKQLDARNADSYTAGFIGDPNLVLPASVPISDALPQIEGDAYEPETGSEGTGITNAIPSSEDNVSTDKKSFALEKETDPGVFTANLLKNVFADFKGDNLTVSPINIYLALGILAETTDNNTRNEILSALNVSDIDELRIYCNKLWNDNYANEDVAVNILGNSLWLDDSVDYNYDTVSRISDLYHTSTFKGDMGSSALNDSLHNWMNSMTGNFLKEQTGNLNFSEEMITSIVTTIYFKDSWVNSFNKNSNTEDTFRGAEGNQTVTYMNASNRGTLYRGSDYTASSLSMNNGYSMLFILPDEGKAPEDLMKDGEALDFILSSENAPDGGHGIVNYTVPKFDISSQLELSKTMSALGVKDVFSEKTADFSPLTTERKDICVSSILHGARVKIDEDGCEAAAYTAITVGATAMPTETYDFILDKPFIFVIRNTDGEPLFVGTVNNIK